MNCWDVLGITPTVDKRKIKLAYAVLLKRHKPDDDAEEFQIVRKAYEDALNESNSITTSVKREFTETPADSPHTPTVKDFDKERPDDVQNATDGKSGSLSLETTVGDIMDQVGKLYGKIEDRINIASWMTLFSQDCLLRLDVKEQLCREMLVYIAEHPFLPGNVLSYLNDFFGWTSMELEFSKLMPQNTLDFIFHRIYFAPFLLPMDDLKHGGDANVDEYLSYRDDGSYYLNENDVINAEKTLIRAKNIYDKDSVLFYLLGQLYGKNNFANPSNNLFDRSKSLECFEKALEIYPDNLHTNLQLGFLYLEDDHLTEAYQRFSAANELSPDHIDVIRGLAKCFAGSGKTEEALHLFELALRKSEFDIDLILDKKRISSLLIKNLESAGSTDSEKIKKLASLYIDSDQPQKAVDLLRSVMDETDFEMFHLLGLAIRNLEDNTEDAIAYFTKSIAISEEAKQNGYDSTWERAKLYYEAENFQAAISDLEKVIALNSGFGDAINFLADAYSEIDELDTALKWINQAISLEPNRWLFRKTRAMISYERDEYREAITDLEYVIEAKYYAGHEHYLMGEALYCLGDVKKANDSFQSALKMNEDSDEVYIGLAKTYYSLGEYENALDACSDIENEDMQKYFWTGISYYGGGKYYRAIKNFIAGVKVDNQYCFHTGLIGCYLRQNDYKSALDHLEELSEAIPDDLWVAFNLGYSYCISENWNRAVSVFENYFQLALKEEKEPNPHAYYYKALACYNLNNKTEAAKLSAKLVGKTDFPEYMEQFASLVHYEIGEYGQAIDLVKQQWTNNQTDEHLGEWMAFLDESQKSKQEPIPAKSDYFKSLLLGGEELKHHIPEGLPLMP